MDTDDEEAPVDEQESNVEVPDNGTRPARRRESPPPDSQDRHWPTSPPSGKAISPPSGRFARAMRDPLSQVAGALNGFESFVDEYCKHLPSESEPPPANMLC